MAIFSRSRLIARTEIQAIDARTSSSVTGQPAPVLPGRLGLAIATAPTSATNNKHARQPDGDQVIGIERFTQAGDVRLLRSRCESGSAIVGRQAAVQDGDVGLAQG